MSARAHRLSLGALVLLIGVACPAERRGLSRSALLESLRDLDRAPARELPEAADVAGTRVPAPAPAPRGWKRRARDVARGRAAGPLERARLAAAFDDDLVRAKRAWLDGANAAGPLAGHLLAHRCFTEGLAAMRDEGLVACGVFLDRFASDGRAPAVLSVLIDASRWSPAALGLLEAGIGAAAPGEPAASTWTELCAQAKRRAGPACADLRWLAAGAALDAAARAEDAAAVRAAVAARGLISRFEVTGPLVGDVEGAFRAGRARGPRLTAGHRTVRRVRAAWDGAFATALRADEGLYTLRATARGAGAGWLYVSSRQPTQVFVDGRLVLERDPWRDRPPETSRVRLRLGRGAHDIHVVTWGAGLADGLRMAWLDDAGRPLLSQVEPRAFTGRNAGARVEPGRRPPLVTRAEAEDLAAVDALLALDALARVGLARSSVDRLEGARDSLARFGFAPAALAVAHDALVSDDTAGRGPARAAASAIRARLVARWSDYPGALDAAADLLAAERPDQELGARLALAKARPDFAPGQLALARTALARGVLDVAAGAAEVARARSAHGQAGRRDAVEVLRALGHPPAKGPDPARSPWDDSRAQLLLAQGDRDGALTELERICDGVEGHPAEELLSKVLAARDPSRAVGRTRALLERFPNDLSSWRRLVEQVAALEGAPAARRVLERAQLRFGADPSLQALAEELGTPPPGTDRLAIGDAVIAARRASREKPFDGHAIVFLRNDLERWLFEDESSRAVRHWIAELRTKDALDALGELRLGEGERLLRLRVVKPDGRVLEPEFHDAIEDISLTGLELGDIVEFLSTTTTREPVQGGFAFETVVLDVPSPAVHRMYRVRAPRAWSTRGALRVLGENGAPSPVVEDEGPWRTWTFTLENVDALPGEPLSSPAEETARLVGFAYGVDVESWARLRGRGVERAARAEPWLSRAAIDLAGAGTAAERFARLEAFVSRRIEPDPQGPVSAVEVLATGRGARTPLLLALARAADIDADVVALKRPDTPPMRIPSASHFLLLGVRARLPEGPSFAFVDGNIGARDALAPALQGAQVLDLTRTRAPAGPRLTPLPDRAIDESPLRVSLDLNRGDAGVLGGFFAVRVPAWAASGLREGLKRATDEQRRAVFERALGETLPGVRVVDVTLPNLDARGAALGIGVGIEVPFDAAAEPVRFERMFGQGAGASLGLLAPLNAYLSVGERKRPALVRAAREELEVEISLGDGAAFTEVPEQLDLRAGPFRLEQRTEVTDGTLFWRRTLATRNARVSPSEWAGLRPLLSTLAASSEGRLSFVLPQR